ncbi:WD40/YVTN repeat-like-containing domain protein [Apiospora aurea]|uniref:WD40/YVTN repeat-like-containing domain protein n=1 Tax=Apiospora aurea TaxID=335848 RepID=A0ABR1Q864_9PEZI
MSKQYLTAHTVDNAHIANIFAIAATKTAVLSASGSSCINVHATNKEAYPLVQSISNAHKLGCHHLAVSRDGKVAASIGFAGELKTWKVSDTGSGDWEPYVDVANGGETNGEAWALALSEDGSVLATTTHSGRVNVWLLRDGSSQLAQQFEPGSVVTSAFGMSIDISHDGKYTATGHENGAVYIYNNETGRIVYQLPGLAKPVRAVAFSPAGTKLAAAGDSMTIELYDLQFGEHVAQFTGHAAWIMSIDWSDTGEYLLSGAYDGKAKVWSIDKQACVATHSETEQALLSVKWLPKTGMNEMFCTAGANKSLTFYREATGTA